MIPPDVILLCGEEVEFVILGDRKAVREGGVADLRKGVESNF